MSEFVLTNATFAPAREVVALSNVAVLNVSSYANIAYLNAFSANIVSLNVISYENVVSLNVVSFANIAALDVINQAGIGTASPAVRCHIEQGQLFVGNGTSYLWGGVASSSTSSGYNVRFDNTYNGTAGAGTICNKLALYNDTTSQYGLSVENSALAYQSAINHTWYTGTSGSGYGTQRMQLTSQGLLQVGNAVSTTNLFANTLTLANATSTVNVLGTVTATILYGVLAGSNTVSASSVTATSLVGTHYGALAGSNTVSASSVTATSLVGTHYGTLAGSNTVSASNVLIASGLPSSVIQGSNVAVFSNASGTVGLIVSSSGQVGVGTNSPGTTLQVNSAQAYNASGIIGNALSIGNALGNSLGRPNIAVGSANTSIWACNSGSISADDGFLRIAAGGGSSYQVKSYIDLSGYSTVADMNSVAVFGTAGVERMRINSSGNVGIGTTNPQNTLDINGSQIIRNPTVYNVSAAAWYNIGLWVADGGVGGQRLRLELIGGSGYDNSIDSTSQVGGVTTIYASILNNFNASRTNCGGTYKHDGSAACCTAVKFVQNGSNRTQYYVYVNMSAYTQHGLRIDATQGTYFTPSFTSTSDPGANSSTVQAATFIGIFGYSSAASVGIGTASPSYPLDVNGSARIQGDCFVSASNTMTLWANTFTFRNVDTASGSVGTPKVIINSNGPNSGSPQTLVMGVDGAAFYQTAYLDTQRGGVSSVTPLAFRMNGTEYMRISSSGNIGIGTASPGAVLDIQGGLSTTNATYRTLNVYSYFGGSSGTGECVARMYYTDAGITESGIRVGVKTVSLPGNISYPFQAYYNGTALLSVTNGGNVGIGTASPNQTLHVYGNMQIDRSVSYYTTTGPTTTYAAGTWYTLVPLGVLALDLGIFLVTMVWSSSPGANPWTLCTSFTWCSKICNDPYTSQLAGAAVPTSYHATNASGDYQLSVRAQSTYASYCAIQWKCNTALSNPGYWQVWCQLISY